MDDKYDWKHADRFIRDYLRRKLFGNRQHLLDDLTQTALIRLVRAARREDIQNFEGLMITIAHRTLLDAISGATRTPTGIAIDDVLDDPEFMSRFTDPLAPSAERLELLLLELFDAECRKLAIYKLDGVPWKEVAKVRRCSVVKVRQHWSRCSRSLRNRLRDDPTWCWGWS